MKSLKENPFIYLKELDLLERGKDGSTDRALISLSAVHKVRLNLGDRDFLFLLKNFCSDFYHR